MRSDHKKRKELTDFYMWMIENKYDHNIRIRVENKAELYLRELNRANEAKMNSQRSGKEK